MARHRLRPRMALLALMTALAGAAGGHRRRPGTRLPPAPTPSPAPENTGPKAPIVVRDHRTIRSFPANLGHNMLEVWGSRA